MKFQNMLVALAFSAIGFSACTTEAKVEEKESFDLTAARTEIQAMEDAFAAGEKAKDAKAVAAYYSDDAVSYGRNSEPTVGKAAIEAKIAKRFTSDTSGVTDTYKIVDLYGNEDMLVEIGSWTSTNPAGVVTDKGHYMSYFEKRNGKYVCVRDMTSTTAPAAPAEKVM